MRLRYFYWPSIHESSSTLFTDTNVCQSCVTGLIASDTGDAANVADARLKTPLRLRCALKTA
jgi:hypothetical protein